MDGEQHSSGVGDPQGSRGRVLVVEDDRDLCNYLAECLEMAGYQTILSNNGLEGLQALEAHRPHLAVVDLNMPVMSGFRFLHLLKQARKPDQPSTPVIVISGSDVQETMDLVVETKPDAYLTKPFRAEQLLERVESLLDPSAP